MTEEEPDEEQSTPEQQRLVELISRLVAHVANEPMLRTRYEAEQQDKFARLCQKGDGEAINKRLDEIVLHLGGPPRLYILRRGEIPPPEDGFPGAALQEVLAVFERARAAVIRAHMSHVGIRLMRQHPGIMPMPDDPKAVAVLDKHWQESFWEHAETAYIRMASYWDRVGQVLNFAFFNLRSFKYEGFQSVMDRIHDNVAKMDGQFAKRGEWQRFRTFQASSKDDGYKWLQERRNLIVHSLHLQPIAPNEESNFVEGGKSDNDTVFTSQFNHLDHAHREKLRPRDSAGEVILLVTQLDRAAALFNDFLSLLEASPSKKRDRF
jgi:hypothetical protein